MRLAQTYSKSLCLDWKTEEEVVRDEGESEDRPWGKSLACRYQTVD